MEHERAAHPVETQIHYKAVWMSVFIVMALEKEA